MARQTGGGKSLCFQLPSLVDALRLEAASAEVRYKMAVVITPNISLMVDQERD